MSNQYDEFLNTLKEGDTVIHKWGSVHYFYEIRTVAKVTKTQFVLDNGKRFHKNDGGEVGAIRFSRVLEANKSNLAIIDRKEEQKRRTIKARQIAGTRFDLLSENALDAIQAIIDSELAPQPIP
jgi:hypothetical protein